MFSCDLCIGCNVNIPDQWATLHLKANLRCCQPSPTLQLLNLLCSDRTKGARCAQQQQRVHVKLWYTVFYFIMKTTAKTRLLLQFLHHFRFHCRAAGYDVTRAGPKSTESLCLRLSLCNVQRGCEGRVAETNCLTSVFYKGVIKFFFYQKMY